MYPRFEFLKEKKLVGKQIKMSLSDNKTGELWQSFMPRKKEIKPSVSSELYSIEIYQPNYFDHFNPNAVFEKWAAIEVADFEDIPDEMQTITLTGGLYVIFLHRGLASNGPQTFQYIFGTWLPNSEYLLDNRPHFEVMGEKYKNDDLNSEEELWIPVKTKMA